MYDQPLSMRKLIEWTMIIKALLGFYVNNNAFAL